jgi:hypothetical protein
MRYAIQTLEIEIARLERAIRDYRASPNMDVDQQGGMIKDFEQSAEDLRKAIKILKDYKKEHREDFGFRDDTDSLADG